MKLAVVPRGSAARGVGTRCGVPILGALSCDHVWTYLAVPPHAEELLGDLRRHMMRVVPRIIAGRSADSLRNGSGSREGLDA
jgi:hypothetical protein